MGIDHAMIPTRYKSKLSSALSWPIGAEELSLALKDVPQFHELSTTFYFNGVRDLASARTTAWMTLLEFRYRRREMRIFDSDDSLANAALGRHWEIYVKPVLREKRKRLHDGILLQLPRVASWFLQRDSLRVIGQSVLLIVWNAKEDTVYVSSKDTLELQISSRKAT
jgi:hypothetical protein